MSEVLEKQAKTTYDRSIYGTDIPSRAGRPSRLRPPQKHTEDNVYYEEGEDLPEYETEPRLQPHKQKGGWLIPLGAGMLSMVVLSVALQWAISGANALSDQWHYGEARTHVQQLTINSTRYQATSFTSNGRIEIVLSTDRGSMLYVSPVTIADSKAHIVDLAIVDINGDGKQDIEVSANEQEAGVLYQNKGGFQWTKP